MKTTHIYYVNFEMDNDKDSARGGAGNWEMIEVDPTIPEEDVADAISDEYGWLVYHLIRQRLWLDRKAQYIKWSKSNLIKGSC